MEASDFVFAYTNINRLFYATLAEREGSVMGHKWLYVSLVSLMSWILTMSPVQIITRLMA